jgi:hypothetical protein
LWGYHQYQQTGRRDSSNHMTWTIILKQTIVNNLHPSDLSRLGVNLWVVWSGRHSGTSTSEHTLRIILEDSVDIDPLPIEKRSKGVNAPEMSSMNQVEDEMRHDLGALRH